MTTHIADNLNRVRDRLFRACSACGRDPASVELVAVSKKKPSEAVQAAVSEGQLLFGENRVQEAMQKKEELPGHLRWHLIGHLQSNKVRPAIQCEFECIHSVDSLKLMHAVNKEAGRQGRVQPVLIQINVSGEASKFGIVPEEFVPVIEEAVGCMHIRVDGVMTLPPLSKDPEKTAPFFSRLRKLRDDAREKTGFDLPELSMGMSHDMEVAIKEGATLVRIGTDIFGKRTE